MGVWAIPPDRLQQSRDRAGIVILLLPTELRDFIAPFDHGLLPGHQRQVDQLEVRQLRVLASGMPAPVKRRTRDSVALKRVH